MGAAKDGKHNAKDNRRGTARTPGDKPQYTHSFIRFELSAEQKDDAKALIASGDLGSGDLAHFDNPGYSWRTSPQNDGATRLVTVTCSLPGDPNDGRMLTGRGRDTITAFLLCVYKDKYLADDGIWSSLETDSGDDSFG